MFKRFYPDIYIDSAYDIDYEGLYNKGYRGIIFDIDNTLVEHGRDATKRAVELLEKLREIGLRRHCFPIIKKKEWTALTKKLAHT